VVHGKGGSGKGKRVTAPSVKAEPAAGDAPAGPSAPPVDNDMVIKVCAVRATRAAGAMSPRRQCACRTHAINAIRSPLARARALFVSFACALRHPQMRSGEIPLEVGARLSARWRDGEHHPVRVIERRKRDPARGGGPLLGDPTDYEYYVHYEQCALWKGGRARARSVLCALAVLRACSDGAMRMCAAVNRRMDSWVTTSSMDLPTTEYDQARVAGARRGRAWRTRAGSARVR
jgi:hypothetical protein